MLHCIDTSQRETQALALSPTRELAEQTQKARPAAASPCPAPLLPLPIHAAAPRPTCQHDCLSVHVPSTTRPPPSTTRP